MVGAERWRGNVQVVSPSGAVQMDLVRSRHGRDALARRIEALQPGVPVVLCAKGPGAIRRCRKFAAETGVRLEREYLAFPSAGAPAYLVEDAPSPVRVFVRAVLVMPPGMRFSLPIQGGLALARIACPWRLLRAVAPGRIAVGRST
jgi:hypothetical protein